MKVTLESIYEEVFCLFVFGFCISAQLLDPSCIRFEFVENAQTLDTRLGWAPQS